MLGGTSFLASQQKNYHDLEKLLYVFFLNNEKLLYVASLQIGLEIGQAGLHGPTTWPV